MLTNEKVYATGLNENIGIRSIYASTIINAPITKVIKPNTDELRFFIITSRQLLQFISADRAELLSELNRLVALRADVFVNGILT